jgi:hypothetical protein
VSNSSNRKDPPPRDYKVINLFGPDGKPLSRGGPQIPIVTVMLMPATSRGASYRQIYDCLRSSPNDEVVLRGFASLARDQLGNYPMPEHLSRAVVEHLVKTREKIQGLT